MGDLRCEGEFSTADLKTDLGHISIDHCGELRAHTDMGDVTVERASGRSRIKTGSGKIRVRHIDGVATVKNGNGSTYISHASGELSVSAANGDVSVEQAGLSTTVKTSNGDITVGEVAAGASRCRRQRAHCPSACAKVPRPGLTSRPNMDGYATHSTSPMDQANPRTPRRSVPATPTATSQ